MIKIPRQARINLNASFFHVIIQGHKKEYIFKKERYIHQYLKLIKENIKAYQIKIIAYCIMNNHAHFLFQVQKIEELSKFMHKINSLYAKYYNYMENERVGYVYRDRFLSEPITTKRYLIECIKYIHFNPVKAKMVDDCGQYKFSSYNYFCKRLIQSNFIEELTKEDYENICKNINYNVDFLDIDSNTKETISYGIQDFIHENKINLYEIFENRKTLKQLITFLKEKKKIKYTNLREYFEMSKGSMQKLIKKLEISAK